MVERLILYPPRVIKFFSFMVRINCFILFCFSYYYFVCSCNLKFFFESSIFRSANESYAFVGRINCKENVPAKGTEEVFVRIYNKI